MAPSQPCLSKARMRKDGKDGEALGDPLESSLLLGVRQYKASVPPVSQLVSSRFMGNGFAYKSRHKLTYTLPIDPGLYYA